MAAALIFFLRVLLGDLVVTKDGKRYEGEVVEESDDWITVRTKSGDSRIHKDFVARWEKEEKTSGLRLRYFVLRGGGVKVGEVVREGKLSLTLKLRVGEDRVSRSLVVESAPCELTPPPSGPERILTNPRSRRREALDAVYALAFAEAHPRAPVELETLVTVYLDPLEPHAARLAALELMGRLGARAVDALSAASSDRNDDLRMRAASSLGALVGEPRARRQFDALILRWLARGSLRERSWAVEAAVAGGVAKARRELRKLLSASDRALRLKAASALARLGGRAEAGLLMRAAQDASDEVLRKGFLKALGEAVGDEDLRRFAATLRPLDLARVEAGGTTDVEKKTDVHFDGAGGVEAVRRLAEENALATEVLQAAEKYIKTGRPVTLHLQGVRLILAFRWIARQAEVSISVKPGKVCILPGRMTADMSSKDERAQIAERLAARIALPGGKLGKCFNDVGRLAGVNVVLSSAMSERELSMAGLRPSEGSARELLEELCLMTRLHWSILDGAVYVRR